MHASQKNLHTIKNSICEIGERIENILNTNDTYNQVGL